MSGHWPPEWEDPEEEFPEEADQLDAASRSTAVRGRRVPGLGSRSCPARRRRGADQRGARGGGRHASRATPPPRTAPGSSGPAPDRARVRRHRGGGAAAPGLPVRGRCWSVGSLVVCLLLAGLGFTLSHGSSSASSSSSAAGSAGGIEPRRARPTGHGAAGSSSAAAARRGAGPQHARARGSSFVVTASGTRYQQATLAEQVRARLPANRRARTSGATVPATGADRSPAASASCLVGTAAGPSAALRGCVLHLTGGVPPRLVDRATYQGSARVRHRQFESRVGGGTRLHGGQTGTRHVGAAGGLTRESPRPSIG